tara:strand:- start:207 stop:464 length:258 start_codon:yes stop_codon:yes gene_type:complete
MRVERLEQLAALLVIVQLVGLGLVAVFQQQAVEGAQQLALETGATGLLTAMLTVRVAAQAATMLRPRLMARLQRQKHQGRMLYLA